MSDATTALVERFMPDGRLWRLPSKAAKSGLVLQHVADLFEQGRRYLVDYRLTDREAGEYWRSGGWVDGT